MSDGPIDLESASATQKVKQLLTLEKIPFTGIIKEKLFSITMQGLRELIALIIAIGIIITYLVLLITGKGPPETLADFAKIAFGAIIAEITMRRE